MVVEVLLHIDNVELVDVGAHLLMGSLTGIILRAPESKVKESLNGLVFLEALGETVDVERRGGETILCLAANSDE